MGTEEKNEQELISIVVPAYNCAEYVGEMLQSVLDQTYPHWELIFINDGSQDETEEIIRQFQKEDVRIRLFSQENRGQSAARNAGIEKVQGSYIAFVDADDLLDRSYLEILLRLCQEQEADFSICGYEKFRSETGERTSCRIPSVWTQPFTEKIDHIFIYSPCAKLFRTSFIRKHQMTFSEGEQLEDGPFCCLAMLLAKKVAAVDDKLYLYRQYEASTMGNIHKKESRPAPPYHGIEQAIQSFQKYNTDPQKEPVMAYCMVKIMTGLATNMYRDVEKTTRKEVCAFCHRMMQQYFPDMRNNPYLPVRRLSVLPFSHRLAVRLFVFFDGIHLLYPFSRIVSRFLR